MFNNKSGAIPYPDVMKSVIVFPLTGTILLFAIYLRRRSRERREIELPCETVPPVKLEKRRVLVLPSGLANVGNSCYLSSVLQLLAASREILIKHFSGCGTIGIELSRVLEGINEGRERVIKPSSFIKSFSGSVGFSTNQQDAHEFLLALLNLKFADKQRCNGSLAEASKHPQTVNQPIFHSKDPFTGVLLSELICLPCVTKRRPRHISSLRVEPFKCVTLIPEDSCSTVNECVYRQFCVPEKFSDYTNYLHAERCGQGAINQKNPILLPELLFLQVSLLSSETFFKTSNEMRTELELSGPGYRYKLLAMIVHSGSTGHSGHFYCFRRHGRNGWVECNDASVKPTTEAEVLKQRAYILLYQKDI